MERCIDDELPFEIPETWEWVRLGTVFQHNTGKALNAANRDGEKLTYITTSNLYWDRFVLDNLKTMPFTDSEVDKCTVQQGDLLVCEGGDIGRAAIWGSPEPMRIQKSYSQTTSLCACLYSVILLSLLPLQRRRLDWRKRHSYSRLILQCNPQSAVPVTATPRTRTHCQRHRYGAQHSTETVKQPGIRKSSAYAWFPFTSL